MPDIIRYKLSDGSFVDLTPYRHVGNGVIVPFLSFQVGAPKTPQTPLAPALSGSLPTRTTSTLSWVAPDNGSRPPITGYLIFRNGVQVGSVSATARTFSESSLPTDTPEAVFNYTVKAQNADGVGASSNVVSLQWNTVVIQTPTALTNFDRGVMTTTSVPLTWTGTSDSSIVKQGIFEGATLIRDNLDPALRSYNLTGLAPRSVHNNVSVRRANLSASGVLQWSPASNLLSFTLPASVLTHDPAMGSSYADEPAPYTTSAAARVYRVNNVASTISAHNCRVISLTDTTIDYVGGAASAAKLENFLENFYYTSTGAVRTDNAHIEIHWANGNEVDGEWQSGAVPEAWFTTCKLMSEVIRKTNSNGTRRYPKASMWVNMTQYNIRTNGAGTRYKKVAQYLDGFSSSMYPPGRQQDPVVWTPYADYSKIVLDTCKDWMDTGGPGGGRSNITQFATWEIGMPIDHADKSSGNITPPAGGISATNGQPTSRTNITIRPRYFAGGIDSDGKDWKGFLQYIYEECNARGIIMREQLYWNQQSNPIIPNQLKHDSNRTTPNTGNAWNDWVPGKRLPRG